MQVPIFCLVRSYKAFPYLEKCLTSLLSQDYANYTILFVDDNSKYTAQQKKWITQKLKNHVVVWNTQRKFAVRNAYEMIHGYVKDDTAIIVNVDGDDWLAHEQVLSEVARVYEQKKCFLTYGDCTYFSSDKSLNGKLASQQNPFVNKRYSKKVEKEVTYRSEPFLPLHLRTWKAGLFKEIPQKSFLLPNGDWMTMNEDMAIFFPLLEMCEGKYEVLSEPLYIYNIENPLNDKKNHLKEKFFHELYLRKNKSYSLGKNIKAGERYLYLSYSELDQVKVLRVLLNTIQIMGVHFGLLNRVAISWYNRKMEIYIRLITQKVDVIFCESLILLPFIKQLRKKYALSIHSPQGWIPTDEKSYEKLLKIFLSFNALTYQTAKFLDAEIHPQFSSLFTIYK
jgi:glycosyltransferase involved in cell wall biosynthesis